MNILHDEKIRSNAYVLSQAWEDKGTTVILPEKVADEDWVQARLELLDADFRRNHFILLTSGSTGRPKLVISSKSRAEVLAKLLHRVQDNDMIERALVVLPLSYSFAFVNQWVWSRVNGRELVLSPGLKNPVQWANELHDKKSTMLCLVGAQVPIMLRHYAQQRFENVHRVHFAGGPFPQAHLGALSELFPNAEVTNNYGCTEAMPRISVRPAAQSDDASNVGRPLEGIELRISETDEIYFRSPYSAVAVLDDQGLKRIGEQEWIPVGDIGTIQSDGSLRITGRASQVFKRFGEKISLSDLLQTTLGAWPGRAAFYLDVDPTGQQGHVLVIDEPQQDAGFREILKAMRKHHPRTHWPIRIERVKEIPILPNGKIDAQSLETIKKDEVLWRQRL